MYYDKQTEVIPEVPTQGPVDPVKQQILNAAQCIRMRGWAKLSYENAFGVCLVGALRIGNGIPARGKENGRLTEARRRIGAIIGTNCFTIWNDKPGRTVEEVLSVLERA